MRVYDVNAKAIAKITKEEVDAKVATIEATLKKRKTRAPQGAAV
jgi:hypothetical protein